MSLPRAAASYLEVENGSDLPSDQDDGGSRRQAVLEQLKRSQRKLFYANNAQSFEFAHIFRDRLVFHNIPWQDCSPNPSLVQKWFTRRGGVLAASDLYNSAMTLEQAAERPLSHEETAALAFHSSRKLQTVSLYWKGAAIVGTLLWWRKRQTFKLPFWTPKDVTKYDVFPHKTMPLLRGQAAQWAWKSQRLGVYLFLVTPLGFVLGMSSGTMTQVVGIKDDPRTAQLTTVVKERMQQQRADRQRLPGQIGQMGPPGAPRRQGSIQPSDQNASSEQSDSFNDASNAQTDTGLLNDQQTRSRDLNQRQSSSSDPTNESTFQIDKVQQQPRDFSGESTRDPYSFPRDTKGEDTRDRYSGTASSLSQSSSFDWDDDASPTTGNDDSSFPSSQSSNGSAWDRLRQESMSKQPSSPPSQSSPSPHSRSSTGSPISPAWQKARGKLSSSSSLPNENESKGGGSFSFTSEDEEKALPKEQAQKEFDEMLERERGGGSDSGSTGGNSGGGGGWWGGRR